MKRHLFTAVLLSAAVICYSAGIQLGVLAFAAAGLVLESVFWFRLLKGQRRV